MPITFNEAVQSIIEQVKRAELAEAQLEVAQKRIKELENLLKEKSDGEQRQDNPSSN